MDRFSMAAQVVLERCRALARFTEEDGFTTRTFLSEPMRAVHEAVGVWMKDAGADVSVDAAGNLRGVYVGRSGGVNAARLYIGSHLDTVPRAGAFDGALGVMMGLAVMDLLRSKRLRFHIEVVGFSEEEGVRFGAPFIGSRALAGAGIEAMLDLKDATGITVASAIRGFGLDPRELPQARAGADAIGYFEIHIEQGPVLESMGIPLGVVDAIAGQSRFEVRFLGAANHAGTTPMALRRDALAGAAEWIGAVEREARAVNGVVATVGRLQVAPGAGNVIAGECRASLDVRSASDTVRHGAVERLLDCAQLIANRRGLELEVAQRLDQPAVAMDAEWTSLLAKSVEVSPFPVQRMVSGAGHDAMIMAQRMPTAMLFVRSPGGVSHHPDESVLPEDVAAALAAALRFIEELEARVA